LYMECACVKPCVHVSHARNAVDRGSPVFLAGSAPFWRLLDSLLYLAVPCGRLGCHCSASARVLEQ
jgi:hypothetical protein